jgi:glycoside/pentoside/hexuronide:cation symporter, GPH family
VAERAVDGATLRLSLPVKLIYGFGSVAYGLKASLISSLLMLYYNQLLGVPAHIVGLVLSAAMILDALWDPLVGYVSDNLRTRLGRRHPLMYASAVPFAISFLLLWRPPEGLSDMQLAGWLLVFIILARATISLYEVPSSALAPELAPEYHERTVLLGYRFFFSTLGSISAAVLGYGWFLRSTPEMPMGQLNQAGYGPFVITVAAITFVAILLSTAGTHHMIKRLHIPPRRKPDVRAELRDLATTLSNRNFLALVASGAFQGIMMGMVAGLNIYFYTYFWELPSSRLLVLTLVPMVAAPIGIVLAPILSRRLGKRNTALMMGITGVIVTITPIALRLVGLMPPNGSTALLVALAALGLVATACVVTSSIMLTSMIADTVEESQLKTGRRSEGLLLSADNTLQRLVQGAAVAVPGLLLTLVGFPEKATPGEVDQVILNRLAMVYIPTILFGLVCSATVLLMYRLDQKAHEKNLATLRESAATVEAIIEADPEPTPLGPVGVQSRPV